MLSYLAQYEEFFGPLRLFRYLTFRSAMAGATALVIGFLVAPYIIARLRSFKLRQSVRDKTEIGELAALHSGKQGTPTMGGLIIFVSLFSSVVLWAQPNVYVFTALFVYAALTGLGMADDILKVKYRNSKGVSRLAKLIAQVLITMVALSILLMNTRSHLLMSELWVPFLKAPIIAMMPLWVIPFFFFLVIAGSSNAINLTDGIDGLAIGCTVTVALVYGIIAYLTGHSIIADYLFLRHIPGSGELSIVCAALVAASLVFLWFNAYPAQVFMGDTGSLALGGLIGCIAFMVLQPVTLILVGGIFVMEAMSVILQVGSFKMTGKRLFKMSPIHHHFELSGWKECTVVIRFWILSLIFALSGLATLKLR